MATNAWQPQEGPQKSLIDCPFREVFFGGARGGGKTDGVLGKYGLKAKKYGTAFNALFLRRELPMLDDAIERSAQIYRPIGAEWLEQKKTWKFADGGRLRFRPLENVSDADKYQGQNITDVCVEEAGQYPSPKPIQRLQAVLRSAEGVPTQLILTGNPGGAGQLWIKQRYIDPYPLGMRRLIEELPNGDEHTYMFIPSKLAQNKVLLEADPQYINRLYMVGSKELVRAWLEGDWSAIEGAFFDCWRQDLIVEPFTIPAHWTRLVSLDWGSAKPFSVGWWAIATEDYPHDGQTIPRGAMVRYREWYGCQKDGVGQSVPNTGIKMTAEAVGMGIKIRSPEEIQDWVADPSIFSENGGPSIAERMNLPFRPADNRRVGGKGALGGWDAMRQRIKSGALFCFTTCIDSLRTIPVLQHDDLRPEDVDSDAEDHAADEWRYAVMSRPFIHERPKEPIPITQRPNLQQHIELHERRNRPIHARQRI